MFAAALQSSVQMQSNIMQSIKQKLLHIHTHTHITC